MVRWYCRSEIVVINNMRIFNYKGSILASCVLSVALLGTFTSCKREVGATTVAVKDSIRHYYPMVLTEKLYMKYDVTNTGSEPLVINDIQPSCGCVVTNKDLDRIILPGETMPLEFTYDSSKNVGFVKQIIRVYANVVPKGMFTLEFDVNVVKPTNYSTDYEECRQQNLEKDIMMGIKEAVDGTASEKGYYIDENSNTDSRSYKRYPWEQ